MPPFAATTAWPPPRADPPVKKVLVYKTNVLAWSETFIKEQVTSLTRWHGVLVGVNRTPNGLDLEGLDLRLLGDLKRGGWRRLGWTLARHLELPPPGVVARLAEEHAQLVHIHFGTEAARFWPVAKALQIPVLVTLHGFDINTHRDWWESGKGGHWMRGYPRRLVRMAESGRVTFIAVSEAIRSQAISFGLPPERVIVRHIGIDVQKFHPAGLPVEDRKPRILFTGRLVEKKGVAHLIRAFARVRAEVPAAELIIAGDGPLQSTLAQLAADLHCPVSFLGSLPAASVKEQMDQARVLCLPSVTTASGDAEGFGMVIIEAQACGVPVITSARGGAQEGILDGVTGFAHTEGDEERMAALLIRLLTEDELVRQFSLAARDFVQARFDILRCSRLLEATYDDITAGRNPAAHPNEL